MGSRSTPPAVAAPAPTPSGQPPRLLSAIKKESPDDEIKEYAETAMNELLGWYGYDKLDSRDTQGLNLHHFAQRSPSDADSSDAGGSSPGRRDAGTGTGSSQGSPPLADLACAWCQKTCRAQQLFSLRTAAGQKAFCSEVCFTQCRRANFKRNKTCDWCRHVRHTVNYVDFQDGEHQLQFCSDKCLNQYKMNIFCKETQAHLQLHPHLQDGAGSGSANGGGGLITPDLWLRDCRSDSPISDRSASPPAPTSATPGITRNSSGSSPPPPVPPSLPEPTPAPKINEHKDGAKHRRLSRPKRGGIRVIGPATVTSVPAPTDLRTTSSSSPRSAGSVSPPKPNSHMPPHMLPLAPQPPILHPPPHLLPPHDHHLQRHPQPFLPPGLLPPPPSHLFPEAHHHPQRFPLLRPTRGSPPSPQPLHPPPLLPLPTRPPPPRLLLPPITVMVPYPIVLPVPIPIPIPIPLFPPKKTEATPSEDTSTPDAPAPGSSPPLVITSDTTSAEPKTTTSDRPLRKRKRLGVDVTSDEEGVAKRKSVPV